MPNVMAALEQEPPEMYIECASAGDGQTSCKVCLASVERRRCSNEAKMRNPMKFVRCPKLMKRSQALVGEFGSPYCEDMCRRYCCLTSFFPIVDTCLSCEDIAWQSSAMAPRWQIFASCIFPRAASTTFQTCILNSHGHTKATPWVELWQTSNLRRVRLGEEKKDRRRR